MIFRDKGIESFRGLFYFSENAELRGGASLQSLLPFLTLMKDKMQKKKVLIFLHFMENYEETIYL